MCSTASRATMLTVSSSRILNFHWLVLTRLQELCFLVAFCMEHLLHVKSVLSIFLYITPHSRSGSPRKYCWTHTTGNETEGRGWRAHICGDYLMLPLQHLAYCLAYTWFNKYLWSEWQVTQQACRRAGIWIRNARSWSLYSFINTILILVCWS